MAGHSKWATIQHTKAKQDALRGAVFTKMSCELIVAARTGGDVQRASSNFELPDALMADLSGLV